MDIEERVQALESSWKLLHITPDLHKIMYAWAACQVGSMGCEHQHTELHLSVMPPYPPSLFHLHHSLASLSQAAMSRLTADPLRLRALARALLFCPLCLPI